MKALFTISLLLLSNLVMGEESKRCLLVYSYHVGYSWNDAVDRGATEVLQGECQIDRFYMDSKRNPDPEFIEAQAAQAYARIQQTQPDVVIAVDDNASKFLVVPYLKGETVPVVFAGVNWSVEEYGYPFSNVTGMVEVAPIEPLFLQALQLLYRDSQELLEIHVIDAGRFSAYKEYERIRSTFEGEAAHFQGHFVETFDEWKQAYIAAQQGDLVMLINNAGIQQWDDQAAKQFTQRYGKTLSIGINDWMSELVLLTMAKEPEEQGEWAAEAALSILAGVEPSSIPIVTNRRWNSFINRAQLKQTPISLPDALIERSRWVGEQEEE